MASLVAQHLSCGSNVAIRSTVMAFSIVSTEAIDPSLKGSAAQSSFIFDGGSSHGLEFDPARVADPLGSIEDLQRDQVSVLVIVENDAGLVFVALGDRGIRPQDDAQRVGSRVISGFHGSCSPIHCYTARPVNSDDLGRVAVDVDEHAKKIGLAGQCDTGLQHVPARPHSMALLGCREHLAYDALLNAAAPHFKRRVACDEVIVNRLRHATAAQLARGREAALDLSDKPDVGPCGRTRPY